MKLFNNLYKKSFPIRYAKGIGVKLGNDCEIHPDVFWGSEPYLIKIGNHVRITNGVKFITHDGGVWVFRNKDLPNVDKFGMITIGDNVHIGINAIIMPGVTIGSNVVIGCGSIVTKDIPDNSIAVGVPAKVVESIEEYHDKVKSKCDFTKNMDYYKKRKYLTNKFKIKE